MVIGVSSGQDWGEQKNRRAAAIPSFSGFWGPTNSLHTIARTDRSAFPIRLRVQKTQNRVAARCRRRLWRQPQNSLDSPAIAVIFKRSSLNGEQVHGINWSPACHILKHFPNFLYP